MSTQQMSMIDKIEAIRIVSLPIEINTVNDVFNFVVNILKLDATSVNIVPMHTDSGVKYRTAFVDIVLSGYENPSFIQSINSGGATINSKDIFGGIHFDNGKPMSHIKILSSKKHGVSTEPLQLEDGEWSSIYIPIIPSDLSTDNCDVQYNTEETMKELFESHLKIGKVCRIDFITKAIPNGDRLSKCAYVHFDKWYDNTTTNLIRKTITTKGEFNCTGYYKGFEFIKFDNNRYISFKINHKPIPAVTEDMNIHQLSARVTMLEEQNAQLEKLYHDSCLYKDNKTLIMINNEENLTDLISDNSKPMTQLDIRSLLIENHRLKEELARPLTIEETFNQVQTKMHEFKKISSDMFDKYGDNDAVNNAGVFDEPEFEEYKFDFVTAIIDLYDEYVKNINHD
jgi:hypothetical protein